MRLLLFIFTILCALNCYPRYNNIIDVDFMESMTDGNPKGSTLLTKDEKRAHYLKIFQENYEAKKPSKMQYHEKPIIPKIMHQIWDGPIPPLYQNYLDECKRLHPDWEFKIWSDQDAQNLDMFAKDAFNNAPFYVPKADILRFELLYQFGGVYRDMDVKCYRPIDDLNHMYDFYSNLEGPLTHKYPGVNLGTLAAKPKHQLMHNILQYVKDNSDTALISWDEKIDKICPHDFAFENTFRPFTDEVAKIIQPDDKMMILPASYFCPVLYHGFKKDRSRLLGFFDFDVKRYFYSVKPESLQMHNFSKRELIKINDYNFAYSNALGYCRKKILDSLTLSQQKIYKTFESIYKENININFCKENKTPLTVNFVVFNDKERDQLENHLPMWKILNGMFDFVIWDKEKLNQEIMDITYLDESDDLRFYLGLKILEKHGGNYAKFSAKPNSPIFELSNKYNFYAGMRPIEENTLNIELSYNLIGASQNNPIITKIINNINIADLSNLPSIAARQVYKNIFLYGKNIVMPASCFESLKNVKDYFIDKMQRYFSKQPNLFIAHNPNSIVE